VVNRVKPICFYLPQYHPIPENDEWWGTGFTEWTNVKKALPNFVGHDQPRLPGELGYYDLRDPAVQEKQAELAQAYGIYGFCFYYYWFNGRRVLERPLNQWHENTNIKMPYCVCWANENWTRRWDGLDHEILLKQNHTAEDDEAFLRSLLPLFRDDKYIKVNGAPMLVVYRVDLFPDMNATAARWRSLAKEAGYPDLHLCAVQFHGIDDPRKWGFDVAVEFPPHNFLLPENVPTVPPAITNKKFTGGIVDYTKVIAQSLAKPAPEFEVYRGLVPGWDNTARRQHTGHMMLGASPFEYEYWLTRLVAWTRARHTEDRQFIFINAWNEWGEGTYLEPDKTNGRLYLEATKAALESESVIDDLLRRLQYAGQTGDELRRHLVETFESRMQALVALNALFRTGKSSAATLPTPQQYVASYAKQYKPVRYAIRRTKALTAALKKKLPSGLRR
jgi:lipopolysaccharide biosynthesis protein